MNMLMKSQVETVLLSLRTLNQSIEVAALKDDGEISKEEQKEIDECPYEFRWIDGQHDRSSLHTAEKHETDQKTVDRKRLHKAEGQDHR